MQLSSKAIAVLVLLLVLWILWCLLVIQWLMPHIELHFAVWHWLGSWILCLLPVGAVAGFLLFRIQKRKVN
jgi:UPF0716 family protein affecting phage T7 exclusion